MRVCVWGGRGVYTRADGSCREWSNLLDIQMRLSVSVLLCDPGTTIIQHRRCFPVLKCSLTFFVLVLNTLDLVCSRLVAQEKLQMVEMMEMVEVVEVVALGFNVGTSPTFLQQAALCPSTLPSSSRL